MQATLAQDYFQLRTLDVDQQILNNTVKADKEALLLVRRKFAAGTASLSDIASATQTLKAAEAQAIDNGIARATFEHAIAVLIGKPPSCFSIKPKVLKLVPPPIPIQVPSCLLERRPDVAQAERTAASANAQIGVAIAAFFPTLTLTGTYGFQAQELKNLISQPALFWSIGAQLTQLLLDGGLHYAQYAADRAVYLQDVALYRQAVLAAFQDVEDNLASLRILKSEIVVQRQNVAAAQLALKLLLADYKAGTAAYTDVIVAQTNLLTAQKTYSDTAGRRMTSAVGLIKALGGGWDACGDICFRNAGKLSFVIIPNY
jgi:NodT family efflux transporter outer membrane factor (OMF) lipoprotein